MSYRKAAEDLNTSVCALTNLMTDTLTSCVRNYKALLPYLGKKETSFKTYQTLLQVNMLLKKLNEELGGLRVEYATVSLHDHKGETIQSEGGRKRRICDDSEVGRHETKCRKKGVPFSSNNNNCSKASTSKNGINEQSENMVSMDTEERRHSQLQKLGSHCVQNTKLDKQDSNEVVDLLEFTIGNSQIPPAWTSSDTVNNVCFSDNEKSAYVTDTVVGGNAYDKPAVTFSQMENNDECVVVYETSNQDNCKNSAYVLSKDHDIYKGFQGKVSFTTSYNENRPFSRQKSSVAFTNCDKDSTILIEGGANSSSKGERSHPSPIRHEKGDAPGQRAEELSSAEDEQNCFRKTKKGKYLCTVCKRGLKDYNAMHGHIKGGQHRRNLMKKACAKDSPVSFSNCNKDSTILVEGVAHSCNKGEIRFPHSNIRHEEDDVHVQRSEELCSAEDELYGIIRHKNPRFKCTVCDRELVDYRSVLGHVRGNTHKDVLRTAMKNGCAKKFAFPKISFDTYGVISHSKDQFKCTLCNRVLCKYQQVLRHVEGKKHRRTLRTVRKNSCFSKSEVPNTSCESTVSVSA